MKSILFLLFIISSINSSTYSQRTLELFSEGNFEELIKLEKKSNKLTSEDLYYIGYAFFRLENDKKAIECYDKAISKGLDDGSVHFYKGLSLCYLKKYDDAMKEIDISLVREPSNQEYMNQKGLIFNYQGKEDEALDVFEQAIKLPNTYGEPFFWVAYINHGKNEFTKALSLYYIALDSVPKDNDYYLETLESIGKLEYTHTKDYVKSAIAYAELIELNPKEYSIYPKLIKAYNSGKEYQKADLIFEKMKVAYKKNELSQQDMDYKNIAIDEFEWNEQKVVVYKYLVDPNETLDLSFKVYLLSKAGDKVERTFLVEKTIQFTEDGAKHLLCEKNKETGSHTTYPFGWSTDVIPLDSLEEAIVLVLNEKIQKGAESKSGKK